MFGKEPTAILVFVLFSCSRILQVHSTRIQSAGSITRRSASATLSHRGQRHRDPDTGLPLHNSLSVAALEDSSLLQNGPEARRNFGAYVPGLSAEGVHRPTYTELMRLPRLILLMLIGFILVFTLGCSFCVVDRVMSLAAGEASKSVKRCTKTRRDLKSFSPAQSPSFKLSQPCRNKFEHEGRVICEWDQTPSVVTLYAQMPSNVFKDDLEVVISSKSLEVSAKGKKPPLIRALTHDVIVEKESVWRLCSTGELQVRVKKKCEAEWPSLTPACHPEQKPKDLMRCEDRELMEDKEEEHPQESQSLDCEETTASS